MEKRLKEMIKAYSFTEVDMSFFLLKGIHTEAFASQKQKNKVLCFGSAGSDN